MSAASDPRRPAPPRSTLDWTLRLRELSSSSGPSRCWCRNQTNDEWSRFISIIPLRYAQRIRAWARTRDIRPACGCDGWRDRTAVRAGRCLAVSAGVQKPRLLHRIVGRAHRTRAPRTGRTGAPLRRRACTLPRSGRDARHRDQAPSAPVRVLRLSTGSVGSTTRASSTPAEGVLVKTTGEAMDPKNKFAAETVRHLQQSLDEVAPYQATELSKQQTIRTLSPQIPDRAWIALGSRRSRGLDVGGVA